jgi:hypothetical protein
LYLECLMKYALQKICASWKKCLPCVTCDPWKYNEFSCSNSYLSLFITTHYISFITKPSSYATKDVYWFFFLIFLLFSFVLFLFF